jgi:hypothetical protein
MTKASLPPSDPSVSSLLSLVDLLADPEAAREKIQDYSNAKTLAEEALADARETRDANVAEAVRLSNLKTELEQREIAVVEHEKAAERTLDNVRDRETKLRDRINAHESDVKAQNTVAADRDSKLGRREFAVAEQEAAALAVNSEAQALKVKYEEALEKLQSIVRV